MRDLPDPVSRASSVDGIGVETAAAPGPAIQPSGTPVPPGAEQEFTVKARSGFAMVVQRFLHHRLAVASLVVFVAIALWAFIGQHIWHIQYFTITNNYATGPSMADPFGTDDIGHDLYAEVMHGASTSISVAAIVALLSTAFGTLVGALAGFYGRWVDAALMRFTDLVLTVPVLAVLLVLANLVSKTTGNWFWLGIIIAGLSWTYIARLVRGTFLSLREKEFVEASRAIGASDARIILRHLLPNAAGPIIVNATLTVAAAILIESTLSFLGLGIQPPDTSLGLLVDQGQASATTQPWLFYFPAVFIVLIVLCVNFIGDGLRDALDPRQNRVRA